MKTRIIKNGGLTFEVKEEVIDGLISISVKCLNPIGFYSGPNGPVMVVKDIETVQEVDEKGNRMDALLIP